MQVNKILLVKTDEIPIDNKILVGNSSPLVDVIYDKRVIGTVSSLIVERNQLWIRCSIEEEYVHLTEQYPVVPIVNAYDRIIAFYVKVSNDN